MRCRPTARAPAGTGFGFGIFVPEGGGGLRHAERFCGEINLSSVQRGPFQSAYVGYWIDQSQAGHGYMPEAVVLLARFAFEQVHLHRIQISIIPRNHRSRRVVEKLKLRDEGVAQRYLEINGVWEDHIATGSPSRSGRSAGADPHMAVLTGAGGAGGGGLPRRARPRSA
jgi:ribosomal-protein-alanine N-acetyltransferase